MKRAVAGLWSATAILVGVGVTIGVSTAAIGDLSDEVDANLHRIEAWDDLDSSLVTLDAAERDYAYTGDHTVVAHYQEARTRVQDAAQRVRLALDRDVAPVVSLLLEVDQHVAELDASVARTGATTVHPARPGATAGRRAITAKIRARINELDDHAARWRVDQQRASLALLVVRIAQIAGLATSLAIVIIAFRRLRREVGERRASEAAAVASEETLAETLASVEHVVAERTAELSAMNSELEHEIAEHQRVNESLRTTEAQLLQSQKLESIGLLAGGIAHDFNNLLSVIVSYGEVLEEDLQSEPERSHAAEIKRAGMRAADLTRQLLAFSRRQVLAPRIVHLDDVIAGMEKMLKRMIGEHIDLRFRPQNVGRIEIDPSQLEQVLMNLVVNARDAMPSGGTITVETATVERDGREHAMIAVTDTGIGMDRATVERIFEPFFTTKEPGKGTGLGLSTVFGIVQQSHGQITVDSEPGAGTTFRLYFPTVTEERVAATRVSLRTMERRGDETILLVEDEDAVRKLARSILVRAGYSVLEACNGEEALAMWKQSGDSVDLLVSDVVMPKMGGRFLVEELQKLRPELPVLFMSGYTDDMVVRHGITDNTVNFMQKPLTQKALLSSVRQVLDAEADTIG